MRALVRPAIVHGQALIDLYGRLASSATATAAGVKPGPAQRPYGIR
jgi:hypothetical protein